jgi:hypothetical protein
MSEVNNAQVHGEGTEINCMDRRLTYSFLSCCYASCCSVPPIFCCSLTDIMSSSMITVANYTRFRLVDK